MKLKLKHPIRIIIAVLIGILIWKWYYAGMPMQMPSKDTFGLKESLTQLFHPEQVDLREVFGLPFKTLSADQRTGKNIENQWPGREGFFVPAAIDNVPVYKTASFKSTVLKTLHVSERVRIVYKLKKPIKHDDETGYWVFILTEDGSHTTGWVFDTYLGYTNRFEPVKEWYISKFSFRKGEYYALYNVKENGRYLNTWCAEGSGLKLRGKETGQLCRYLNVIWVQKDEPDSWFEFFSMDKDENIQIEWKYNKCPFKVLKKL